MRLGTVPLQESTVMTLLSTTLAVQLALSPGPRACIEKRLTLKLYSNYTSLSIQDVAAHLGVTKAPPHSLCLVPRSKCYRSRDEAF